MIGLMAHVVSLGLVLSGGTRLPSSHRPRVAPTLSATDFVSAAAEKAAPSVALVFDEGCETSHGCACVVMAGTETMLITSSSVARTGTTASLHVALSSDGFTTRHAARQVGQVPECNLVLLKVACDDVTMPSALSFSDDGALGEGDFVIALGNPQGPRGGAALGLLVGRSSSSMATDAPNLTPGTAEAAMAEAEAEAEAEARERGEEPFLIADAALVGGASGGPLLDSDGAVVGINTLVISAGEGSTRYYAVSARRCVRAVESLVERRALGEEVDGMRVVLLNDGVNKRERVAAVLAEAGLSEQVRMHVRPHAQVHAQVRGHSPLRSHAHAHAHAHTHAHAHAHAHALPRRVGSYRPPALRCSRRTRRAAASSAFSRLKRRQRRCGKTWCEPMVEACMRARGVRHVTCRT